MGLRHTQILMNC